MVLVRTHPGIFFMQEPEEESEETKRVANVFSVFISKYSKGLPTDYDCHFTTEQIFHQLQEAYPSELYGAGDVYALLDHEGFKLCDLTNRGRFEWLFKLR